MSILDYPEDTLSRQERITRAREAGQLMESEVLREAWDYVELALVRRAFKADTVEEREEARLGVAALASLREVLSVYVMDGMVEAQKAEK